MDYWDPNKRLEPTDHQFSLGGQPWLPHSVSSIEQTDDGVTIEGHVVTAVDLTTFVGEEIPIDSVRYTVVDSETEESDRHYNKRPLQKFRLYLE